MKKIMEAHKANLKARQARRDASKMHEHPDPRMALTGSPLFEPEHAEPPDSYQKQHDNGLEVNAVEPAAHKTPPISLPRRDASEAIQTGATQKRKVEDNPDDDGDDFDNDDGNDVVGPHDPDSEPLPDLPMYHPAIKDVEVMSNQLISQFEFFIENSDFKDEETEYLLQESKELRHPPHEKHILRIALIGDAGQGKSSLLNSVLGYENLAIHAADGNSCTYVVVEYAQAAGSQKTLFEASVEFHSREACRDIVKSQVKNYFANRELGDEADDEEVNEGRLSAGTCTDLLRSLFMGQPEFQDQEHVEEFLEGYASADDPLLISKLMTWTEEILDKFMPDGNCNDVAKLTAVTASEISESIQPFTMRVDFPSFEGTDIVCCPWPLVKKVRVSLYSRILDQGTIIADLPGTSDKNRARVEAARRYLQQCDMTIVVNNIDRAIDDAALHNAINDSFRRRRSGNTIVVCTRSDDLNVTNKQSFRSTPAEEKAICEISRMDVDINKQLQQLGVRLNSPAVRRDQVEKYKLMAKRERVEREKAALVRRRLGVRIAARNRHVKQGIIDQYRQDTKDLIPLAVFCVSNPIYMQHLGGNFLKKNPPDLTLEETEIPALRTHIFSKPSLGRFATLEHYCQSQISAFFNTITMSCSVSKIKRKKDLERTFQKMRAKIPDIIQEYATGFSEHDFERVYGEELVLINRAKRKCDEWAKASYTAVLKHDGNWGTKTVPPQEWNRGLLVSVQEYLNPIFEHIHGNVCDQFSVNISEAMCHAVTTLDETLKGKHPVVLTVAFKLTTNLKERRKQIDLICKNINGDMKKEVRKIQIRATTDDPGHYFTEAMKPIYKAAVAAPKPRGQRVYDGRAAEFKRGVSAQGGPFMAIPEGIKADWDAAFREMMDRLTERLDDVFKKIQHDVTQVCSTKEDDSPEATAFRADLLAMLPEAWERLEAIRKELAKCRQLRGTKAERAE
ncbi:hypothetical protein SVAN01_10610 [Stagonosporopsis vannaccii]|nr:hypothetical protein SVAN01_10610 [Stagonosporopsis vannaccii]